MDYVHESNEDYAVIIYLFIYLFILQKKCIHECLEENKPSKSPPPPTEPGKVADEVSLVTFGS